MNSLLARVDNPRTQPFSSDQEKFQAIRNTLTVSEALKTCIRNEVNSALDKIYSVTPENRTQLIEELKVDISLRALANEIRPTQHANPLTINENNIFVYIVPKIIEKRREYIDTGLRSPLWVMGSKLGDRPNLTDGTAFFIDQSGDSTVLTNPGMQGQYEKAEVMILEFTLREIPQQPLNRSSSVIPQYPQASTLQRQYPQHQIIQQHYQQPGYVPTLQPSVDQQQRRASNPQQYYSSVNYTQPVVPQPVVPQGQYIPQQGWPPQTQPYHPNNGQQYPNGYPPSGY